MNRFPISLALALGLGCSEQDPTAGGSAGSGGGIVDASADDAPGEASPEDAAGDPDAPAFSGPETLSETGLYSDIETRTLAPDVIEFDVRFPLWSDGADKQRYLYLPPGTTIDTSWMDVWKFPVGTKAWKEFSVGGKTLETRLLEKTFDGPDGWLMVSYLWNAAGTDATAVPLGAADVLGTSHDVPSQAQCTQCHNGVGDVLAGVGAIQLSTETGSGLLSQLVQQGKLSHPPAAEFPVPGDGVVEATLGYLHGNCGNCHNDQHFLASKRPLRLKLTVDAVTPEQTPLYQTAIGGKTNHIVDGTTIVIVPGKPLESQLWVRMNRRDEMAMPPVGSEIVDDAAVALVSDWIVGLVP